MSHGRHGHGHDGIKALKHAVYPAPAAQSTSDSKSEESKSVSKSESKDY